MRKSHYRPVQKTTLINDSRYYHVSVATHNRPTVTLRWGSLRRGNAFKRRFEFDSREEARDYAEERIARMAERGFVEVVL